MRASAVCRELALATAELEVDVKRIVQGLVLLLCLSSCGSDSSSATAPTYNYGISDMQKVVVGDYTGTLTPVGKSTATLTMRLDYAPPGQKPACGSRTLCVDMSSMGVTGKITTSDGTYKDGVVTGAFDVFGTELVGGSLSLRFPDTTTLNLPFESGKLRAQGDVVGAGGVLATIVLTKTN